MNNISLGVPVIGGGQRQILITDGDTIDSQCQACKATLFDIAYRHKVLPRINPKNPTGKDWPLKVEVFVCRHCGWELGKPFERNEETGK